jgi:SAM-dependent methyltransferase
MTAAPQTHFQSLRYLRMNLRRLEHLATLGLPLRDKSVLELGAGIGDLTSFFLDRGCAVTSVEPRAENVAYFRARYEADPIWPEGRLSILQDDAYNFTARPEIGPHQVVFAYGLLYHLDRPLDALTNMASRCTELLLLETVVSREKTDDSVAITKEDAANVTNSVTGGGCVPTRQWVFNRLKKHFGFVYMPLTQPAHDQFRLNWLEPPAHRRRSRAIFVASRTPLNNARLADHVPDIQHTELP